MPDRLEILTLGGLRVLADGAPVRGLASRKAEALLVYLACQGGAPTRETLSTLLWDDRSTSASLSNLSVLLTSLRKSLAPFLRIDRDSVSLVPGATWACDAVELARRTEPDPGEKLSPDEADELEAALALYAGSFLEGFFLRDARGFEEWSAAQRERLRMRVVEGHRALVQASLRRRDYGRGLRQAQRLLAIDPLSEAGHRAAMLLYARQGEMARALAQYQACREILHNELGVDPSFETVDLYHRLRSASQDRLGNLPVPPTSFVGRAAELERIEAQLADPAARLLTIVGPGGAGKTRLAIEAASRAAESFLHGVCFVPVGNLDSAEQVVPAVARALGFGFQPGSGMKEQLAAYLRERELLLLLDGIEHVSECGDLIGDWLLSAPEVRILGTSRTPLRLVGEWLLELGGLPYSIAGSGAGAGNAVELFERSASRVRPGFRLKEDDLPWVERICRRVDGLPLALELAGAWMSSYTTRQVAEELDRSLDFLADAYRGLPERQRSLRAVFEHTWGGLTPAEQDKFRRLCIFRGALTREAARAVSGAEASDLAALVDRSLLHRVDEDRFEAHEVLRVYGRERAVQEPEVEQEIQRRFRQYYADLLHRLGEEVGGPGQAEAMRRLSQEADHLRAAWISACESADVDSIERGLAGLARYYMIRGLFQVGAERFGAAARSLRTPAGDAKAARTLGAVLARAGGFEAELARYEAARALLEEAEERLRQAGDRAELVFCLNRRGVLARKTGHYTEARQWHEEALATAQSMASPRLAADSHNNLGNALYFLGLYPEAGVHIQEALDLFNSLGDTQGAGRCVLNLANIADRVGDFDSARRLYEQSRSMSESVGDRWGEAASLNNLGNVLLAREDYREARRLYSESLAIKRDLGHREGVAASLDNLGRAAFALGEMGEARLRRQASLDIRREIGDSWGISNCLVGLGDVALVMGHLAEAEACYREALRTAVAIDVPMLVEAGLVGWAELLARRGEGRRGLAILDEVLAHGGKDKLTQAKALRVRAEIAAALGLTGKDRTGGPAIGGDLAALARQVLGEGGGGE